VPDMEMDSDLPLISVAIMPFVDVPTSVALVATLSLLAVFILLNFRSTYSLSKHSSGLPSSKRSRPIVDAAGPRLGPTRKESV
jgi:hypothetical protein